jgi:hypothetical protein
MDETPVINVHFSLKNYKPCFFDRPVDVWAIGCIMAEIIDGQPLFPGASDVDQLDIIQRMIGPLTEKQMMTLTKNGKAPKSKVKCGK